MGGEGGGRQQAGTGPATEFQGTKNHWECILVVGGEERNDDGQKKATAALTPMLLPLPVFTPPPGPDLAHKELIKFDTPDVEYPFFRMLEYKVLRSYSNPSATTETKTRTPAVPFSDIQKRLSHTIISCPTRIWCKICILLSIFITSETLKLLSSPSKRSNHNVFIIKPGTQIILPQ